MQVSEVFWSSKRSRNADFKLFSKLFSAAGCCLKVQSLGHRRGRGGGAEEEEDRGEDGGHPRS